MPDMPASLQELQRRMPGRTQHSLKDSLLSQEVAVNLLQENKIAIRRCELVIISYLHLGWDKMRQIDAKVANWQKIG